MLASSIEIEQKTDLLNLSGVSTDDNLPTGKDIIFESPTDSFIGYRSDNSTGKSVNIYSHFGRPDIWPRGFPLDDIDARRPVAYLPEYTSIPEPARGVLAPPMLIQQGLADLNPDVDAIFRLTQVQELKQAWFCKRSPSLRLSPGTFSPFNSQVSTEAYFFFHFSFCTFSSISSISGGGSSMRRKILVISLLNSCREMEMKYLVRTLVSFLF